MNNLLNTLDENLILEAEDILDEIGLDITTAIRMTLKKIINEGNVNFLITTSSQANNTSAKNIRSNIQNAVITTTKPAIKMTKNKAINYFLREGYKLSGTITFASKNKSADNYWANPNFTTLNNQWNIILNDWIRQELYLFVIPANSINASSLVCRADKKNQIDLQIMYEDPSFTDMRSKISFFKYLVSQLKY